jgi:surface antigen
MFKQINLQCILAYFRTHRVASIAAGHVVVIAVLGATFLSSSFGSAFYGAFAAETCASGDHTYLVNWGDTLGAIASQYGTTYQSLAAHNNLPNPNLIFVGQRICIPHAGTAKSPSHMNTATTMSNASTMMLNSNFSNAARGAYNPFPYGECTWWASQRYFQLHGVYVPWTINANAYQWVARAYDFNWQVSSQPSAGSILVLQPNVQGAAYLGHVAVVESVLGNGHVIASSMNWGPDYSSVSTFEFTPGPGVSFVSL